MMEILVFINKKIDLASENDKANDELGRDFPTHGNGNRIRNPAPATASARPAAPAL